MFAENLLGAGHPARAHTLIETETNPALSSEVTVWWERQTCVQTVNIWDDQNCDGWGWGRGLFRPLSRQGLPAEEARRRACLAPPLPRRLCSLPHCGLLLHLEAGSHFQGDTGKGADRVRPAWEGSGTSPAHHPLGLEQPRTRHFCPRSPSLMTWVHWVPVVCLLCISYGETRPQMAQILA